MLSWKKILCWFGCHTYYKFFDTIYRCENCGKQIGDELLDLGEIEYD